MKNRKFGTGGWPAIIAAVCLLVLLEAPAAAQTGSRQVYDLGTATTDGVSHPLGVTIAALIKLKLLPQANIDIDAKNTQGSKDNILRLRDGDLEFGILTNLDAYHALRGTGPFAADGAAPVLRLLTNLWTSTYHFVVRSDLSTTGTFADFLSLNGARVALGSDGSTLRAHARALFTAFDVDVDEAYRLQDMNSRAAVEAFLRGDLDGFLLVDEQQGADLAAFMERAGQRAATLAVSDDQIRQLLDDDAPAWARVDIPANSFPGQEGAYATIGMHNLLGTSEQVAEDAVYQITKTIFDNLPFLQEMHLAAVGISLETALEQLILPVHQGAAAYYREVGVTVPEPEPVRTSTLSQTEFLTRYASVNEARERLSSGTITMLGGQAGETITRMISELATSLDDSGIRVVGMTNPKPAENIADVLYARGVDSAIVPLNILSYAQQQDVYPNLQGKITYATELFPEEVHLLAADTIGEIGDLIDQPVNLGPAGSISEFTASFLLDQLNIPVEPTYHDQSTALTLLKKGELAAVFTVSGKPMPLLSEIPAASGLRLLEIPALDGDAYRPATLSAADYPNLLAAGDEIGTFGVRTILLSYNWRPDNQRYLALSNFIGAFFGSLPELQQSDRGYHPKWQEIDPFREVPGWARAPAAQDWIETQNRPAGGPADGDG